MSKIKVKKVCQFCGKEFIAHKLSTRFCSHQCSQRSYKVRLREQKLEKVLHQENIPNISLTTLKKEYLSCEDVAELMGISSTTVYILILSMVIILILVRNIFIDDSRCLPLTLTFRSGTMNLSNRNHSSRSLLKCILAARMRFFTLLIGISSASAIS